MKTFYLAQAIFENGESECKCFSYNGKTLSKWANKMYHKDENVTVKVYKNDNKGETLICTYHA